MTTMTTNYSTGEMFLKNIMAAVFSKPEKKKSLKVAEIFMSFQGEGARVGKRTLFIRFFGCNLHCPWCDTKPGENITVSPKMMTADDIITEVQSYYTWNPAQDSFDICITGGEPTLYSGNQEMLDLIHTLSINHYMTLETNGSTKPNKDFIKLFDHITLSPKLETMGISKGYSLQNLQEWVNVVDRLNIEERDTAINLALKFVVRTQSIEDIKPDDVAEQTKNAMKQYCFENNLMEINTICEKLDFVKQNVYLMAEGIGEESITNTRKLVQLMQKSGNMCYSISARLQCIFSFR